MKYSILFLKSLVIIIASSIVGFLLLLMVFALPTEKMESHVKESVKVFQKEGTYPKVKTINKQQGTTLDNFTDAYMLLMASYPGKESLLDRTINAYKFRIPKKNPRHALVEIYSSKPEVKNQVVIPSYGRYWHGYLTALKPMLMMFNYRGIRHVNAFFVLATTLALILILYKRRMQKYIIPYLLVLLLLDPFAISKSLQFSTIYYVSTVFSIILLLKLNYWKDNLDKVILLFVLIGCTTSYVDFLTYPLVSFGIPATFYFCAIDAAGRKGIKVLIFLLLAWCFGYTGMWAAKWIIGDLLLGGNIIKDAIHNVIHRTSMIDDGSGKTFTLFSVFERNFKFLNIPIVACSIGYIIGVISLNSRGKPGKMSWLPFIFIGILPFIWYVLVSNHSYIHPWMAYREFGITIFALMCMVIKNTSAGDVHILERGNNG